jgi:uncharacterized hydrophobic protein (TIGR00271 family)
VTLRLIEIVSPANSRAELEKALRDEKVLAVWQEELSSETIVLNVLLQAENVEPIMDRLERKFSTLTDFHLVLLPVEAALPRPEIPDAEKKMESRPSVRKKGMRRIRVSREELYAEVVGSSEWTYVTMAMVILSAIVASIGLLKNSVALIIGAMVIAPLLGPNVALSLATTLGDFDLGRQALKVGLWSLGLALIFAVFLGVIVPVDAALPEIASRTRVDLADIVVALASGAAGALAVTTGTSTVLIGVMVAVALMPPLVACGLLLGQGSLFWLWARFYCCWPI